MPGPDSTPDAAPRSRSVFAGLAVPHSFHPDLGPAEALVAVVACLARIFGACVLFALWGGFAAWAWSAIPSHFWRMAAVGPLVLLFAGALAALMLAISSVEVRFRPKR